MDKLSDAERKNINREAIKGAQKDLETGELTVVDQDENNEEVDLTGAEDMKQPKAGDNDLIEINTELWDSQDSPYDGSGDTPFKVKRTSDQSHMTAEEREQKSSDEIMEDYSKKYGKKSIFDELWEKEHPEEAKQMKVEQKQKIEEQKKKDALAKKKKEQLAQQKVKKVKKNDKAVEEFKQNQAEFVKIKEDKSAVPPEHFKHASEKKAVTQLKMDKSDMTPEQQYQQLVDEATKEDPFKEPIKDLIDNYADLTDKQLPPIQVVESNKTSNGTKTEAIVEARIKEKLGIENRNNYGSVNATQAKVEKTKTQKKAITPAPAPIVKKQKVEAKESVPKDNVNLEIGEKEASSNFGTLLGMYDPVA